MVQRWTESEGSTVTIQLDFVPLLDDARKTKLHTLTLDINVHRTAGFNSNKFEKLKPRFRRWATIEGSLPDQKRHGPCSCTISEYRALAIPPPGESLASWGPPPAGYDPSNSKTWRVNGNGTGPDDSHDESMDEMDQDGDLEDAGGQEARRGGKRKLGVPPKGRANATASGSARPRPRVSTSQANGTADPVSPRKRRRSQSSAALIGDAPTRADYNSLRAACDRSEAENHDLAKKLKTLSGQFDESQGEKRDLVAKVEGLSDALASLSRRFEEFAKGSVADARGSGIEIEGPGVGKEELEKQVGEPASEESDLDDAPVQADLAAIKAAADPDALKTEVPADFASRADHPIIDSRSHASSKHVLIIGAGPHALAVAARLREARPAALFTDLEHARLAWLHTCRERDRGKRITVKGHWSARKLVPSKAAAPKTGDDIKVLDSSAGGWLGKWDAYFRELGISHLRSPMFFHPSPSDTDALVAFARREGREGELVAIPGVVGKEKSKHARKKQVRRKIGGDALINERSREDYHRPGTALFRAFCEAEIINRYELSNVVSKSTVTSLSYGSLHLVGEEQVDGFVVESVEADGTVVRRGAKRVVIAVGPHSTPNIPQAMRDVVGDDGTTEGDGWCHSSAFARSGFRFPGKALRAAMRARKTTTMVVIGGGLTSAQICDLAVQRGVSKVILLCRGHLKVRHFDFGLEWVTKFANSEKMKFWQEDGLEERLRIVREARGGGSVNPTFHSIIKALEKSGSLDLLTFTTLTNAAFDPQLQKWSLSLSTFIPDPLGDANLAAPRRPTLQQLDDIDFVVCSTGSAMAFDQIPFLAPLLTSHPIEMVGGFPKVTKDLAWSPDLPVFVVGAYGMLELLPTRPPPAPPTPADPSSQPTSAPMARIVLNNGFKPFAFPGCDIFSPDLNLHLWQGCWETGLADSFAGSEAARTSQPDGLSPEDSELLLSEDSARQREAVVKEIHKANESSRELLALVERYAGRSAEELWTTILTQKQREQLIMYAARDVCTLPSIGEGKRDLVPELMLWELAADEGRRFWSIVKTVIGAPTEAEFSYPRVRYAPYDNKLAEGYSKDALPASRAMRAWRVWNLELRHNFISALVFRILLYLCYNAKADRNNNRSIGAGDYLIEDDLDILAGYSTRALKDQSFGPAPTVAAIAKRLANECSKCHKTSTLTSDSRLM
ncbi:hypothetical protein RQP46_001735 [Phenoliferia psychrophenolica]